MEHQNRAGDSGHVLAGRAKVTSQNVGLVHALVGKEPICGFRVGPILAGQRNAFGRRFGKLFQHHAETLS